MRYLRYIKCMHISDLMHAYNAWTVLSLPNEFQSDDNVDTIKLKMEFKHS